MPLTQAEAATRTPGRYLDEHGLYLIVTTPTQRAWVYRYMRHRRGRVMTLGNADVITLSGARELHLKARAMLAAGVDPLDERHAAKRAAEPVKPPPAMPSFRDAALAYITAHEPSWQNKSHRRQWRQTVLEVACAKLGDMPVDTITANDVLSLLQPIWTKTPATASRTRGRIEVILDYARVRGWRDGANPALWRGNLALLLPSPTKLRPVKHHAALPWKDAPAFMASLRTQTGSMGALALQFAILTAARSGEVRLATWHEIDLAAALWAVPAARMKARRVHRVPLSDAALALLKPLAEARRCDLVFHGPSDTPLSDMTLTAVLRRMQRSDLTAHGFRSTFRDWCSDNGKPADAAELALAHAPATQVQAAYARSALLDLRRTLMAEWANFLTRPPATVVALPGLAA